MTTNEKYKHQSLGQGKHIRVLSLHPSRDFQAPVRCSLREISLEAKADKSCFYDALSYVWGSPTGDREIICDGQTLMVTDNCLTALRYLRPKKKARTLWVDAICIDQSSINERSHQVKLMGDVYKLARRVLIWLGEGDADSPGLMRRMRWLGPCMPYKSIVPFLSTVRRRSDRHFENSCPPYERLLAHPWFSRTWTLQELVLAQKPVVVCGFHTANWKCLTSWDNSTTPYSAKITDAVRLSYRANSELYALSEHILQPASLKDQYSQYYYLSMMGGVFLIADVTRRIASDPKDLVYGLYSMLTDMGYNIEEPDYDKSIAEIYEDFSFGVIERTRSLYTLWAFPNSISLPYLPSWVLDLQKRSTQPNARDLSIASYDENRLTYFRKDFTLQRRQRSQLFLEGLICGSLEMLGAEIPDLHLEKLDRDPEGSIRMTMVNWLSKTLELSDHITKCPNGQSGSSALLDTLCTMADGSSPPQFAVESVKSKVQSVLGYHAISCDPDMRKRFATACNRPSLGQLSSQDMFDHLCKSYDPQVPPLMSLLFDLFWKSQGTTPVLLSNGCIGLGYGKMQVGDKVVLLYGSMSPMIVRPSGSHYQLIGPADIGGIAKQQWPLREDQEGIEMITLV